ncbi:MAG: hypothetical protein ACTS73_09365 [Arsenophonus sp. NEOnobi-MAG3]
MLALISKGIQSKVKAELRERVWLAEKYDATNNAIDVLLAKFLAKYLSCSDEDAAGRSRRNCWHSTSSRHRT